MPLTWTRCPEGRTDDAALGGRRVERCQGRFRKLRGHRDMKLPFEQPTRYALVLNRKTADALGIKVSNELLLRADRVIE